MRGVQILQARPRPQPPSRRRPHEDAGDAAHDSVKDTARSSNLAGGRDGQERDLDSPERKTMKE
jgi:hypothetical protein